MKKHRTIPIFVPHLGCPNDCSFCNQKKITGADTMVSAGDVKAKIEEYLATMDRCENDIEVGFFGGSFTGISAKMQEELLGAANEFLKNGDIDGIRLSTRPDYIDEVTLKRLKSYGVTTVELGVQSMNDDVLKKNLRGHTVKDIILASDMIRGYGINLGHQVMPGLPGDTPEIFEQTVRKSIELKPDCVRIYPTLVIRDTLLARWYSEGEYKPLELSDAIKQCKYAVKEYRKANVNVIRTGLLGSDNINTDADIIAGPCHPAFGELVESALVYDEISNELSDYNGKSVDIYVNPRFVSVMVGHKRENIERWKSELGLSDINILQDENVKPGEWRIICI